jgi:hypothetical protein
MSENEEKGSDLTPATSKGGEKRPLDGSDGDEVYERVNWWEFENSSDEYQYESSQDEIVSDNEQTDDDQSDSQVDGNLENENSQVQLNDDEIEKFQRESGEKLLGAWADIIDRYSDPQLSGVSDVIDLETGVIVEDHGHIRTLERDTESLWRPVKRRHFKTTKNFKGLEGVVANVSMWNDFSTTRVEQSDKADAHVSSAPVLAERKYDNSSPTPTADSNVAKAEALPTDSQPAKTCGNGNQCGRAFCFTCN